MSRAEQRPAASAKAPGFIGVLSTDDRQWLIALNQIKHVEGSARGSRITLPGRVSVDTLATPHDVNVAIAEARIKLAEVNGTLREAGSDE